MLSEGVERLLEKYNLAGMKILQFAFNSGATNPFLPHNYSKNSVVYTGTHDNDTCLGILEDYEPEELQFMKDYCKFPDEKFACNLTQMAWASISNIAVAPLQDLLQLGKEGRMNTPGTIGGNWYWKFEFVDIKDKHKAFLKKITEDYGRE